jgi:hypothetical protein
MQTNHYPSRRQSLSFVACEIHSRIKAFLSQGWVAPEDFFFCHARGKTLKYQRYGYARALDDGLSIKNFRVRYNQIFPHFFCLHTLRSDNGPSASIFPTGFFLIILSSKSPVGKSIMIISFHQRYLAVNLELLEQIKKSSRFTQIQCHPWRYLDPCPKAEAHRYMPSISRSFFQNERWVTLIYSQNSFVPWTTSISSLGECQ